MFYKTGETVSVLLSGTLTPNDRVGSRVEESEAIDNIEMGTVKITG